MKPSVYVPTLPGVYTLKITYNWYFSATRVFTWTLLDACANSLSAPISLPELNLTLQKADTYKDVSATYTPSQMSQCPYSINVSAIKDLAISIDVTPGSTDAIEFT